MNQLLKKRSKRPQANPKDQARVPYQTVRDRFLTSTGTTDDVEWLVAVGRFVQDRWLAEEQLRNEGEAFDEQAAMPVWDECTEKHLRDLRSEAGIHLKKYSQAQVIGSIFEWATASFKPVKGFMVVFEWIFWQFLRGIVSGLAIIVLGLIIVSIAPDIIKKARGNLDTLLPQDTSPYVAKPPG